MKKLVSYDVPARAWVAALIAVIVFTLAILPLTTPSIRSVNMAAKIIVFIPLAASFILLIGYTGIVSFAHTVFFGIGGYALALGLLNSKSSVSGMLIGLMLGIVVSALVGLVIALLSLRIRAIYFAMVTLVAALVTSQLASRLTWLTGGQDGVSFDIPEALSPGVQYWTVPFLDIPVTGKVLLYYALFAIAALSFLAMLRIVNSPFGRVLQAIRENEFRAGALGYPTIWYKALSSILAAMFATIAGGLYAVWLGYVGPGSTLSLNVLTDILLIIVIGGSGSLYGAIVGAVVIIVAENYLQSLIELLIPAFIANSPVGILLSGDRWLLWLGILYVVAIYLIPEGVVGMARSGGRPGERPAVLGKKHTR